MPPPRWPWASAAVGAGDVVGISSVHRHTGGQRGTLEEARRVGSTAYRLQHLPASHLLGVEPWMPDRPCDVLGRIPDSAGHLRLDESGQALEGGVVLTLVVVRRHHHVAPLPPFRIVAVVAQHPPPRGVVVRVHLRHGTSVITASRRLAAVGVRGIRTVTSPGGPDATIRLPRCRQPGSKEPPDTQGVGIPQSPQPILFGHHGNSAGVNLRPPTPTNTHFRPRTPTFAPISPVSPRSSPIHTV
ncbi:MAG: hypothetical protein GYA36_17270, partial [Veillonellaceae bacterium]|nr:hypothetical protein [Veillonellaceae bacterium]